MKMSLIKSKQDQSSFNMFKGLGFKVVELEDLEATDNQIKNLVEEKYDTIVITNEVAGFSTDIIKKYGKTGDVNIIIAPSKRKEY